MLANFYSSRMAAYIPNGRHQHLVGLLRTSQLKPPCPVSVTGGGAAAGCRPLAARAPRPGSEETTNKFARRSLLEKWIRFETHRRPVSLTTKRQHRSIHKHFSKAGDNTIRQSIYYLNIKVLKEVITFAERI